MDRKQGKQYVIRALISAVGITYVWNLAIVSIYPLMIFGICVYLYAQEKQDDKISVYIKGTALIFSLFLAGGKIDLFTEGTFGEGTVLLFFIIAGNYFFLCWAVKNIFQLYDTYFLYNSWPEDHIGNGQKNHDVHRQKRWVKRISPNKVFIVSLAFLIGCWMPFWLTEYPAVFSYDSIDQFRQIVGGQPLVDHHPIIHTLWIKMWYKMAVLIGLDDIVTACGFVSMVQLLMMATVFSAVIRCIYQKTERMGPALLGMAFYGLISYNGIYSVTIWKDVTHGMVTVLLILLLCKYFGETKRTRRRSLLYLAEIMVCGCMVCLFRSNAFYAYILWVAGLTVYGMKNRDRGIVVTAVMTVVLCLIIKGPVYSSIAGGERRWTESMSIPLQQIAYCVAKGDELKEEEQKLLSELVEIERIPETYAPNTSDPIKVLFSEKDNTEYFMAHRGQYLKMYFQIGLRYPLDYLTAWIKETYGYWYPDVSYWVYSRGIYENEYGIYSRPLVSESVVEKVRENTDRYIERPLYGSFWCLGVFTWCLIIMTAYTIYRRRWELTIIYILPVFIWGTLLISTPVYAEFRYYYSIVGAFPIILFMPLFNRKQVKTASRNEVSTSI